MTQRTLNFDAAQPRQLARVTGRIAALVEQFVNSRIGQNFHAAELREFVAQHEPTAPASADRILRDLRQRGRVNYVVISRAASEYRAESVAEAKG